MSSRLEINRRLGYDTRNAPHIAQTLQITANWGITPGYARRSLLRALMCLVIWATSSPYAVGGTQSAESFTFPPSTLDLQQIHSVDLYVDNNVVHVLVAGFATKKPQRRALRYLRSTNGGQDWSQAVSIPTPHPPSTTTRRGNDAQLAAHGESIVAVWQAEGELPGLGPLSSAFSSDGGMSWQSGPNPAEDAFPREPGFLADQGYLDLGVSSAGQFLLVWLDNRDERGDYQSLRYTETSDGGRHWRTSVAVDDTVCTCCWTRLLVTPNDGPNDGYHVLFRDGEPRDMALLTSINGGAAWRRGAPVGEFGWQFAGCPHNGGGLAAMTDKEETVLHSTVWTGSDEATGLYYLRSTDAGRTWTAPLPLAKNIAARGDIAAQDARNIAAVWDLAEAEGSAIIINYSGDGGHSWQGPQRITDPDPNAYATHPRIVAIGQGFLVIWSEKRKDVNLLVGAILRHAR